MLSNENVGLKQRRRIKRERGGSSADADGKVSVCVHIIENRRDSQSSESRGNRSPHKKALFLKI